MLYEKNADVPRPPASTTKIMTAILLLEHTQPTDLITASVRAKHTEGSSLHLVQGEHLTARDMLYALMLRSANDGCVATAEHIAGSEERFAQMMTAKAHELGATNTTFQNADGLNENPNRTTARDLSIMARYAQRFPEFNEATRTKYYTITSRSPTSHDVLLKNHAKFLWKFPGADGIKTGWTIPAGHCFVGGATWNGWRLISVVLKSPTWLEETEGLMKWGFQNFQQLHAAEPGKVYANVPVRDGAERAVPATIAAALTYVVARGENPPVTLTPEFTPTKAPFAPGAPLGTLEAKIDGKVVATAPLVAAGEAHRPRLFSAGVVSSSSGLLLAVFGAMVVGYGTAFAKTARRRRPRVAPVVRRAHRRG